LNRRRQVGKDENFPSYSHQWSLLSLEASFNLCLLQILGCMPGRANLGPESR
ncbi:hypothetical protein J6590_053659, partial [Homalodisca vitripennis]